MRLGLGVVVRCGIVGWSGERRSRLCRSFVQKTRLCDKSREVMFDGTPHFPERPQVRVITTSILRPHCMQAVRVCFLVLLPKYLSSAIAFLITLYSFHTFCLFPSPLRSHLYLYKLLMYASASINHVCPFSSTSNSNILGQTEFLGCKRNLCALVEWCMIDSSLE